MNIVKIFIDSYLIKIKSILKLIGNCFSFSLENFRALKNKFSLY
jgi:hypothetical protein